MSKSFADLGVSDVVVRTLAQRGITEPFAVQQLVLSDVLAGHDVLVSSPTGSGKTLAFGLPLVERIEATDPRPSALVLAPTRELATQIVEDIRQIAHARALKVCAVYGGVSLERQAREAPKAHIIVATPGRLEDLINRRAFSLSHIKMLVLDEADRMLDMGFRPAVDRIVAQVRGDRQTIFLSATLEGEAGRIAEEYTQDARVHEHRPAPQPEAAIDHRFIAVRHTERVDALLGELRRDRDLALVFVRTKRGADRLVKRLGTQGVEAVAMHGDKSQRQREKALASFEAGRVDTLVATDVAARGIDVDRISHVINFDPPEDRDAYTHRVGRTGRAGRSGIGITLVDHEQAHEVGRIARSLKLDTEFAETGFSAPAAPQRRPGPPRNGNGNGGQRRRRQRAGTR
ncbi:MAG: ATP-dependent helicase RhlE [Solirubrobacteraceae bacterium]|nr:ATP-dependent helicase RhlE [Solirubrobacteraceae bacterium]